MEMSFDFRSATRVVCGRGAIGRLGEMTLSAASREPSAADPLRVLVVADPGIVAAGHARRGIEALEAAGMRAILFDGVRENPTTEHVDRGVAFACEHRIELIVGLGGGSSMDCAKGINFLLTNGGRMADYWGVGKASGPMLPLVAVPTTAGTGSEAQSFALIADAATHRKMACGDRKAAARVAILDPELTLTQPRSVTVAAGLDAIAHALESYVCTKANAISRMFSREAWRLLSAAFERVLREPGDVEARGAMLLGANLAGAAIENSMLGAAHACANPLTAQFNITHGVAVATMLPHVVRFNGAAANGEYAALTDEEGRAADSIAAQVERFSAAGELPPRLRDHGVPSDALAALAADAATQWTGGFNPRPVSEGDFVKLYEAAW
jgi:alcohol dehydrogenase